jgi:hypothetical protein
MFTFHFFSVYGKFRLFFFAWQGGAARKAGFYARNAEKNEKA